MTRHAAGDLLTWLVVATTLLNAEDDPLRRAEHSCDVAEQLSHAIVFTSLRGSDEESEALAVYLDDIVRRGVHVNLSRFEARGDDSRRSKFERIHTRSLQAREILEQTLERVPLPARKGLERALEVQRRKGAPPAMRGPHGQQFPPGGPKGGLAPPGLKR